MKKNIKKKMKKYRWICILVITILIAMYIYGMASHYFPDPIHIGAGQYLDLATGIIMLSLIVSGIVVAIIFKKKKKVNI